jgi:hypothetical protein
MVTVLARMLLILVGIGIFYFFGIRMTREKFECEDYIVFNTGLGDSILSYYVTKIIFSIGGLFIIYLAFH